MKTIIVKQMETGGRQVQGKERWGKQVVFVLEENRELDVKGWLKLVSARLKMGEISVDDPLVENTGFQLVEVLNKKNVRKHSSKTPTENCWNLLNVERRKKGSTKAFMHLPVPFL